MASACGRRTPHTGERGGWAPAGTPLGIIRAHNSLILPGCAPLPHLAFGSRSACHQARLKSAARRRSEGGTRPIYFRPCPGSRPPAGRRNSMHRKPRHPCFAWLILVWFALTNTASATGMVVCRDGHGGSRMEWKCDRNASSECLSSCSRDGDDHGAPLHPCEDTPISGDEQVSNATLLFAGSATIPLQVAVLVLWAGVPERARLGWVSSGPDRPPDALRRIRTFVLVL